MVVQGLSVLRRDLRNQAEKRSALKQTSWIYSREELDTHLTHIPSPGSYFALHFRNQPAKALFPYSGHDYQNR